MKTRRFPEPAKLSTWGSGVAGGVGLAALLTHATPAAAYDTFLGGGIYVGATFGGNRPTRTNFGLEVRYAAGDAISECSGKAGPYFSAGGVGRLDFVSYDQPRLVLGAVASETAFAFQGTVEASLGLRLVNPGIDMIGGLRLNAGPFSVRVDRTFNQEQWHVGGGLGANEEWVKAFGAATCVEGRPQRDEGGRLPLPAAFMRRRCEGNDAMELAAQIWLQRAQGEWASVAAFFELAQQLAGAGAPDELVQRAWCSAQDEAHHTQLAANVCASLTGARPGFASLTIARQPRTTRQAALRRLATESWADGCINEGIAALSAQAELMLAQTKTSRRALAAIRRDEAAHAALAWDVLQWCVNEGGDEICHDLHKLAGRTPAPLPHPHPRGLAAWGCAEQAVHATVIDAVVDDAQARLQAKILRMG